MEKCAILLIKCKNILCNGHFHGLYSIVIKEIEQKDSTLSNVLDIHQMSTSKRQILSLKALNPSKNQSHGRAFRKLCLDHELPSRQDIQEGTEFRLMRRFIDSDMDIKNGPHNSWESAGLPKNGRFFTHE